VTLAEAAAAPATEPAGVNGLDGKLPPRLVLLAFSPSA